MFVWIFPALTTGRQLEQLVDHDPLLFKIGSAFTRNFISILERREFVFEGSLRVMMTLIEYVFEKRHSDPGLRE